MDSVSHYQIKLSDLPIKKTIESNSNRGGPCSSSSSSSFGA
jgi:hypothetical protein